MVKKKVEDSRASLYLEDQYINDIKIKEVNSDIILYQAKNLFEKIKELYTDDFNENLEKIHKNDFSEIDLKRFKNYLSYQYDKNKFNLKITILNRYKRLQVWGRDDSRLAELSSKSKFSWYLNGYFNQEVGDNSGRGGDFDSALSFNKLTFEGRWNTDFNSKPESLYYKMVRDLEDIPMRFTLGDLQYRVAGEQRGFLVTGASIESNFSLQPYKRFYPLGEKTFSLKNDAWVSIYINDRFYSRKYLEAGPHTVQELPILVGRNKVRILVEEENGRKGELDFFDAGSIDVFKKGIHYFSYALGSKDINLSDRYRNSNQNVNSLFSFYHYYGLTDYYTLGMQGQIAQNETLLGLVLNWRSSFVNGDLTLGRSGTENINNGNYAELNLEQTFWRNNKRFSFGFRNILREKGYKRISENALAKDQLISDLVISYELGNGFFSSIGGRRNSYDSYTQDKTYLAYFQLSKNSSKWGSQFRIERSDQNETSFEFNFNYYWGGNRTFFSQYHYESLSRSHTIRTSYRSPYQNRSIQVDAQVTKRKAEKNALLDLDYSHERFIASADFSKSYFDNGYDTPVRGNLKFASAISYVDGAWGLSRPITNAFAIIRKKGTKEAVLINPSSSKKHFETKSNNLNGVLAQLNSYTVQSIKVESENNDILRFDKDGVNLVPRYKTGYLLDFKAKGDRYIKGILRHGGKIMAMKVITLRNLDDNSEETSFTDDEGRFSFDGISEGRYIINSQEENSKEILIKGENIFIDLGVINLSGK